jgi:hypothetical protein
MGEGKIMEIDVGVNSAMIYCKTFVNVTVYPQHHSNNNKKLIYLTGKEKHRLRLERMEKYFLSNVD